MSSVTLFDQTTADGQTRIEAAWDKHSGYYVAMYYPHQGEWHTVPDSRRHYATAAAATETAERKFAWHNKRALRAA